MERLTVFRHAKGNQVYKKAKDGVGSHVVASSSVVSSSLVCCFCCHVFEEVPHIQGASSQKRTKYTENFCEQNIKNRVITRSETNRLENLKTLSNRF